MNRIERLMRSQPQYALFLSPRCQGLWLARGLGLGRLFLVF